MPPLPPTRPTACAALAAVWLAVAPGCADDDSSATSTASSDATGADDGGGGSSSGATTTPGGTTGGSGSSGPSADSTSTGPTEDPRLAVTADWQAGTLSLLDIAMLAEGATSRDEILVDTIDVSEFAPGPLQVELTSDGATAVVTVSPGFFGGVVGNLIGAGDVAQEGRLLIVDIASRSVTAALMPAHVPMGIAIDSSGGTAYTANYGTDDEVGTTMSVIDVGAGAVAQDIEVGGRPEQVSLSSDGSLGIINLAADGTVRIFETADPEGTLSTPLMVSDDPSDVDFIEGTSYAIVANSVDEPSYAIIDVSDPAAPVLVEDAPPPGGVPYGATPIPGTADALVTTTTFTEVILLRVAAGRTPSSVVWQVTQARTVGFPLGVAVDPALSIALAGVPGDDLLLVVDLDGEGLRTIDWLDDNGPTYVAIEAP
ncbi:MAG: hypothetical protein AAF721_25825 [Myxococcota bacterium]